MKEIIKQIEQEAKMYFENLEGVHDWTHVERVRNMALRIGKEEGADLALLEIAVLLHDIGRAQEKDSKNKTCHAEKSAEWAGEILERHGLSEEQIENILHSIVCHRFRNEHIPRTLEAKCLFDADKLDAIGAIGIARNFLFAGFYTTNKLYTGNEKKIVANGDGHKFAYTEEDTGVLEYEVKLKHLKDRMTTKAGRRIASKRHELMESFFESFWDEVEGRC